MLKTKIIFILVFGSMICSFSFAETKIKYKTFKFYDYAVKYPVEPFLPENRDDSMWDKWKIVISRKGKALFTLDAPDDVRGVKSVNIDGKGKKELVIYGSGSGSGCFWTWYAFSIVKGKLQKAFEIHDECIPDFKSFTKKGKLKTWNKL